MQFKCFPYFGNLVCVFANGKLLWLVRRRSASKVQIYCLQIFGRKSTYLGKRITSNLFCEPVVISKPGNYNLQKIVPCQLCICATLINFLLMAWKQDSILKPTFLFASRKCFGVPSHGSGRQCFLSIFPRLAKEIQRYLSNRPPGYSFVQKEMSMAKTSYVHFTFRFAGEKFLS